MLSTTHGFINIRNIHISDALVGILADEYTHPQPLVIHVSLWANCAKSAYSNNIDDTINYSHVLTHIETIVSSQHFLLLETLCETIAQDLLQHFNADHVTIEIEKPQALHNGCPSICIQREREVTI